MSLRVKSFVFCLLFVVAHLTSVLGKEETLPSQVMSLGATLDIKPTSLIGDYINWCSFGIYASGKASPKPSLLNVEYNPSTPNLGDEVSKGTQYDRSVSFIGNLKEGKPWFRIANLRASHTNTYKMRCFVSNRFHYYALLKVTVVSAGWEKLGCYEDASDRSLPIHYKNIRYDDSPGGYKRMFEECKKVAEEKGYEYFGIQHKSECWGSSNGQEITYNKHGCKNNCLRSDDGFGVGSNLSNFVYRKKKEWSDCKEGVQYKLVSKQDTCYKCPSYNVKIEKSDTKREC